MPLSGGFAGVVRRRQPERKTDMTTNDKGARRKLSLLDLVTELANVSRACKIPPRPPGLGPFRNG
jgi:hypothetical protein